MTCTNVTKVVLRKVLKMGWFSNLFKQPPKELSEAHAKMMAQFRYVAQPNEWEHGKTLLVWPLTKPFDGDCDDAAASVAYAVGGEYVECYVNGVYHAVCIHKGWVSDCLRRAPYLEGEIKPIRRFYLADAKKNGYKVQRVK